MFRTREEEWVFSDKRIFRDCSRSNRRPLTGQITEFRIQSLALLESSLQKRIGTIKGRGFEI